MPKLLLMNLVTLGHDWVQAEPVLHVLLEVGHMSWRILTAVALEFRQIHALSIYLSILGKLHFSPYLNLHLFKP